MVLKDTGKETGAQSSLFRSCVHWDYVNLGLFRDLAIFLLCEIIFCSGRGNPLTNWSKSRRRPSSWLGWWSTSKETGFSSGGKRRVARVVSVVSWVSSGSHQRDWAWTNEYGPHANGHSKDFHRDIVNFSTQVQNPQIEPGGKNF